MNAEINKTPNTIQQKLTPQQIEAELERLHQKSLRAKAKIAVDLARLDAEEKRQETSTDSKENRQVRNLKNQILKTEPKLRGSTATHVGSPRLGPYTRKHRDPVRIQSGQIQNHRTVSKPPITTFVSRNTRPGRVHPSVGTPSKAPVQRNSVKAHSPALDGRTASGFKVGRSGAPIDIQSRLKKKSPWFSSIMDPLANGAVKIPDPVGTDTGTYQHVQNISVAVNSNGIAGLRVVSPYINSYDAGGSSLGSNYQITTPTGASGGPSALGNLAWGSNTQSGYMIPFAVIPENMKAVAQSHRVVSAWVVAQPEVSTLSDAGEMAAFVKPFDCNPSTGNYDQILAQWDTTLMPVNQHKPLAARWYPLSSDYLAFNGTAVQPEPGQEPPAISYQDFLDPREPDGDVANGSGVVPWEFGVVCTGMTPSTGVVRFMVVINYEFIPLLSTGSISGATADKSDITESSLVSGWVSECPVTGVVPQATISRAPAACNIPDEPSGFGMIFNVIEEMLPLIPKAAAMLL